MITAFYFASMLLRIRLYHLALNGKGLVRITDDEARAVPDGPSRLHRARARLSGARGLRAAGRQPAPARVSADRLDIMLLLEEDDPETIEAAATSRWRRRRRRIVLVPSGSPAPSPRPSTTG